MSSTQEHGSKIVDDNNDSGLASMEPLHNLNLQSLVHMPSIHDLPEEGENLTTIQSAFINMSIQDGTLRNESCLSHEINADSGLYSCNMCDSLRFSDTTKPHSTVSMSHSVTCKCRHPRPAVHITVKQWVELYHGDMDGDNKLHISIINGTTECTHLLIKLVPSYEWLNYTNNLRQTPLHLAVLTHQPLVVRRLVCAGADVNVQDQRGDTPLHLACRLGYTDIVHHLLKPVTYGETLQNRYSIPYQRLPRDMNLRNFDGHTCLHLAACAGHLHIVHLLLESGAGVNVGDGKSGRTALHMASEMNSEDLVLLLLSRKDIVVHAKDYAGLTPAQLAFGRNLLYIVDLILRHTEYESISLHYSSDSEFSDDDSLDL